MPICTALASDAISEECCDEIDNVAGSAAANDALSADVMDSFRKLLTVLAGKHALEGGAAAQNLANTPRAFQDDLEVIRRHWQLLTADKENAPQALKKAESDRLTRIRNCTHISSISRAHSVVSCRLSHASY